MKKNRRTRILSINIYGKILNLRFKQSSYNKDLCNRFKTTRINNEPTLMIHYVKEVLNFQQHTAPIP